MAPSAEQDPDGSSEIPDATPNADAPASLNPKSKIQNPKSGIASLAAALLVFLASGYIQNSRPGWNVNSQFALTCAIVERGTLSIDAYHAAPETETGDKAFFNGHYYCDKSPVTAFLGVPAFAAYSAASRVLGLEFSYSAARYWTTWGSVGLSAAALAWLLAIALRRAGAPEPWPAILAALWIAATPLLGYSILFFNYLPACAMGMAAYLLATPANLASPPVACPRRLMLAGILAGFAAWTLPTFALLPALMTLTLLAERPPRRWLALWPWALGGCVAVAAYAAYSVSIFGEITSPYRYEFDPKFKEEMSRGLMGATRPSLRVLWLVTFHPFRGLFTLFPATFLALLGLFALLGRVHPGPSSAHLFSEIGIGERTVLNFDFSISYFKLISLPLALLLSLLLYNSAYFMWWGGWAYAPRHLIPALPWLALGMAPWAVARRRWPLAILLATLSLGALANLAVVALDPQPPPGLPEEALLHPEKIDAFPTPFVDMLRYVARGNVDANWGTRLGLRGAWSLLPLAALWAAGLIAISSIAKTKTAAVFHAQEQPSAPDDFNPKSKIQNPK